MPSIHEIPIGQVPDTFYHGTSEDRWSKIVAEGILWGKTWLYDGGATKNYRYTYMAQDVGWPIVIAESPTRTSPPVILKVSYVPGSLKDNYGYNPPPGLFCTQFCVFDPIPMTQVEKMPVEEAKKLRIIQDVFLNEHFTGTGDTEEEK